MKKRFIVDTNVLINDPDCIYSLGHENDVIIPIGVIEELDSLKKGNSERARACRKAINNIETERKKSPNGLLRGIDLPNGGKLFTTLDSNTYNLGSELNDDYMDNKILQLCVEENKRAQDAGLGVKVILLTKDTALRIKADTYQVCTEDYQNSVVKDTSMYEECEHIRLEEEDLAEFYQSGKFLLHVEPGKKLHLNQYLTVGMEGDYEPTVARVVSKYNDSYGLKLVRNKQAWGAYPKNIEQACLMDALLDPEIHLVAVAGRAGTGKTLLSLAAGLEQVAESGIYKKMTVMRPIVSVGKEMGHLPGTLEEKLEPWMSPVYDNLEVLSGRGRDSIQDYKQYKWLEVQAISHIRGRSIPNSFIIVDEVQNLTKLEVKTIITRAGYGTKIIINGDPYQIDNPYLDDRSNGLTHIIDHMRGNPLFAYVTLMQGERSELAEIAAELL